MTRRERRIVAEVYGVDAPDRGPGRHGAINDAVRMFGGMEGIQRPKENLSLNGSSEGVIFSRAFRPTRRNGYDGGQTKPNRAHPVR